MDREKSIMLYELLCEFERSEYKPEKAYERCNTKEEFSKSMLYAEEMKAINLIKELVSFNF